jgi:hypothetical protein
MKRPKNATSLMPNISVAVATGKRDVAMGGAEVDRCGVRFLLMRLNVVC